MHALSLSLWPLLVATSLAIATIIVILPSASLRANLTPQKPQFDNDRGSLFHGVIGDRHTAIDRLLQDDLLDVVGSEATFDERRAHMQTIFIPLSEGDHSADDQDSPRSLIEMLPSPDVPPRIALE